MISRGARRFGLVLSGIFLGLVGAAFGLWFYFQAARIEEVRTAIGEELRMARESIEKVQFVAHDAIRITLRDVAILDPAGDTILAAPRLALTFDVPTLQGTGPIEFYDVVVTDPLARIIRSPDGEWNYLQAFGITAAGQPVETDDDRPLLFRDIRIVDGRLLLAFPSEAPPDGESALAANIPFTVIGGVAYQQYEVDDIQARLPSVRIGGLDGWRAELAEFTGDIRQPEIRITRFAGWAEQAGDDAVDFEVEELGFGESLLAGSGTVRFEEDIPLYDVALNASPLRVADLRPIFPNLTEEEGTATFMLDIESLTAERMALAFSELDFQALESRVLGAISVAVGGELAPALMDADLELAPLYLTDLEQLGLVAELPVVGRLTGRVSSSGAEPGLANVDLRGSLLSRGQAELTPSVVYASGTLALVDGLEELRLDGLEVGFQPLYLALLREFAPEQAERLRGTLQGSVQLSGTLSDVQLADGLLAYDVGNAPTTRFAGVTGRIVRAPEASYTLSAIAQPLALASLTELFPGLPFRAATVSGPLDFSGSAEGIDVTADLEGAAGGVAFTGRMTFGEPAAFEVEGDLTAFAAGMILRPELPIEGPLSGTFAIEGTTESFDFDVDLTQQSGRFDLEGRVSLLTEDPLFEVAGNVENFRIGSLVGDPAIFPDPMTGAVSLIGGGGEPYRFDVDLTGATGRLDLAGFYLPNDVPTYEATGYVAGLDLSLLPLRPQLPQSALTGSVEIAGRGFDLSTLEGTFAFDATASTLASMPLDAAVGRVEIRDGVAYIDTLHVQLERTRLMASGTWGLQAPSSEPLRFFVDSPDLRVLSRVLAPTDFVPPQVSGTLRAEGTIAGSVEYPVIDATLSGRGLRYEEYRAATLTADLDALRSETTGWQGEIALRGEGVYTPQTEAIQSVSFEASGTQGSFAFSLAARRDAQTDLSASGVAELDGAAPVGAALETVALRLDDVEWTLARPTQLRYTETDGLIIQDLVLERSGQGQGSIAVNGVVPPTGLTSLDVEITNFELSDLRRIDRSAPAVSGLLSLDAFIEGPVESPSLTLAARVDRLIYEGAELDLLTFNGNLLGGRLTGFAEATNDGVQLLTADLAITMNLSLDGMVPDFELLMADPVSMTILADSLPMDVLIALAPGLSRGTGLARARILVGGTLEAPSLDGSVRLVNGAFTVDSLDVRYSGVEADLALTQNRIVINSLSARSGGRLSASGSIDFPAGGSPFADITLIMSDFVVMDRDEVATLTVSSNLALMGPLDEPVLTGRAEVIESEIRVPDLARNDPTLELAYLDVGDVGPITESITTPVPPFLGNMRIDGVELRIGEGVWLESDEMRVQIEGDLILYRSGEDLRVFGALQAVRGTYALEISGIIREFEVISGRVQFFGTGDLNPSLEIVAGYRVRRSTIGSGGDLTILVELGGTVLAPTVALSSDTPVPLPEEDLISYLLFGQPSFELTQGWGFVEQRVVQELVGNLLVSNLQRPIQRAGICDWVRVRPGLSSEFRQVFETSTLTGGTLECGWELTSELFLTAQTGLSLLSGEFNQGLIGLEWQIDQQWRWDASYGTVERSAIARIFDPTLTTQFSTDIRREWEYGRPSQRDPLELLSTEPGASAVQAPDTSLPDAPAPPDAPGLPDGPVLDPIGQRTTGPLREDPVPVGASPGS